MKTMLSKKDPPCLDKLQLSSRGFVVSFSFLLSLAPFWFPLTSLLLPSCFLASCLPSLLLWKVYSFPDDVRKREGIAFPKKEIGQSFLYAKCSRHQKLSLQPIL